MNSKNTKSSSELKKEVLDDLRKVENDLDRMENRLSPGQLIDDAIFYPHGGNSKATFDHLKDNPIGSAFLALGTFLLMEDKDKRSYESVARSKGKEAYDTGKGRYDQMKIDAQSKISEMKGKVTEMKGKVQNKIAEGKAKAHEAADSGKIRSSKLKASISEGYSSSVSYIHEMNPLTFVALGAGLGTITGSSLPVKDAEKTLVNDKIGSRLEAFSKDLQEALNSSAKIFKDEFISEISGRDLNIFKTKEQSQPEEKFTGLEGQEGI